MSPHTLNTARYNLGEEPAYCGRCCTSTFFVYKKQAVKLACGYL